MKVYSTVYPAMVQEPCKEPDFGRKSGVPYPVGIRILLQAALHNMGNKTSVKEIVRPVEHSTSVWSVRQTYRGKASVEDVVGSREPFPKG